MQKTSDETTQKEHFFSLLREFKFGMMVTHARTGELHTRPMAIADVDDAGDLWLLTDIHSEKVEELGEDARVSLALQEGQKFLALSGKGEVRRDSRKVHEVWNETWRTWYPKGVDDPELVLLQIKPVQGEYWDNGGVNRVRYFFEAAKAYLAGERPNIAETDMQGKVALQH